MIKLIKAIFYHNYFRALALLIMSVVIALSLVSHNVNDRSFNSASNLATENIIGPFGSYLSDFLWQYFGYGSIIIVVVLMNWSIVLIKYREVSFSKLRAFFCLVAIFIASFAFNIMGLKASGVISSLLLPMLESKDKNTQYLIEIILSITFVCSFIFSLGYPLKDIWIFVKKIFVRPAFKSASVTKQITPPPVTRSLSFKKITENVINEIKVGLKEERLDKNISFYSGDFHLPDLNLLNNNKEEKIQAESEDELNSKSEQLLSVLSDFGVKGKIIDIKQGPVVTLYEFEPAAGTKSSRVIGLADDIARSLCALSTRIAIVPGRNVLGIELPNPKRQFFRIRELLDSKEYNDDSLYLPIVLGKDLAGRTCVVDLAKMPHLLVAGTTGSGKSVAINAMIVSLLYRHSPESCKFIMIDPKMLELSVYDGIPHLLSPVVTEPAKAIVALKWAVKEMENRYRLMSNLGVRNISGYNSRIEQAVQKGEELSRTVQTGFDSATGKPIYETIPIQMKPLPYIVIIVDEMADLMLVAGKDIESSIQRLAQMARAAGLHLIMATQRPSVDVITGVIKANFPSRVSFKVTSKIDSRTILGEQGAEQLLGMGDMLYMGSSNKISRVHGPFIDDDEVERISKYLKDLGSPDYLSAVTEMDEDNDQELENIDGGSSDDNLYKQALQIVRRERKSSTSYIQRCLRIGYNRAALIVERMEKEGILSEPNHSGKREILLPED